MRSRHGCSSWSRRQRLPHSTSAGAGVGGRRRRSEREADCAQIKQLGGQLGGAAIVRLDGFDTCNNVLSVAALYVIA